MQDFLVALCMKILEKLLIKGTEEYRKYEALRSELEKNKQKSGNYQKIVDKPKSSREERKNAEDELLG